MSVCMTAVMEQGQRSFYANDTMRLRSLLALDFVPPRMRLVCMASLGAFVAAAGWVAYTSNGLSYLSDDPKACINCHIMAPQYATWQHSSHARVATCNDCHVPHDSLARKYGFKAMDGARHSYIFTLRQEPQVIRAREASKAVIQQNCVRCHTSTIQTIAADVHGGSSRACTDCHREVPHGRISSLNSTPNAAVPPLPPVTPSFMREKR